MLLNKLQIISLTDGTTGGTTDIQKNGTAQFFCNNL